MGISSELQARQARAQRLLTSGLAGTATVVGVRDTGTTVALDPELEFDVLVGIDGESEPYAVTFRQVVARGAAANMGLGASVPVCVDPDDPQALLIA